MWVFLHRESAVKEACPQDDNVRQTTVEQAQGSPYWCLHPSWCKTVPTGCWLEATAFNSAYSMFPVQQCFMIDFGNRLYYFASRLSLLVFPNNRHCVSSPNIRPESVIDFWWSFNTLGLEHKVIFHNGGRGEVCLGHPHKPLDFGSLGVWVKISRQWASV